jgi:cell division protein FtsB
VTRWRWLALAVLVAAAVFAMNGGVHSQRDYLALKRQETEIHHQLDSLRSVVDSLELFHDSLATSPVVQERLARERYGMIRPGEILILLVPDSAPAPVTP